MVRRLCGGEMSGKSEVGILDDAQKIRGKVCAALEQGEERVAQSALADLRRIAETSVVLSDRGRVALQSHLTAAEAFYRRKTSGGRRHR